MNKVNNKKVIFIMLIAILFIILLNVKVYAADSVFSLNEESVDVTLNGTKYLSYSGGTGTITWTSSDPSIATVDNGIVTGLKIGTTTITATRGTETSSCTVNVVYSTLTIGGNAGKWVSSVNLILGEHDSENLIAEVLDYNYKEVSNPSVVWTSSDTSIVTVDSSSGELKALKQGTATITATAAGISDTCEVKVYSAPIFTDFSNAKYETSLNWEIETLQISGITPNSNDNYYYIITSSNSKPNIITSKNGSLDDEAMSNILESFLVNTDDNYIYTRKISKYAELNQDLYLWVIQQTRLSDYYYDTTGISVGYSTKLVVEGKQLTRAELPKLNLILQRFSIGNWITTDDSGTYTHISFNFPTDTENRKFTLKIGKVTDNSILSKIQNNDYSGITELLSYAKSHDAIYSQKLTTTSTAYFRSDNALFDGNNLLEHNAYYYIYAEFDDENGKFYPIEGVTLGQAFLYDSSSSWDLYAYTSSDFNWDNLSPSYDSSTPKIEDPTIAPTVLPKAGLTALTLSIIVLIVLLGRFFYMKYNKLKDIN